MTQDMTRRADPSEVHRTSDGRRFVLELDDGLAFIDCRRGPGGGLSLVHTEVPHELSGQGVGTALVKGALDLARAEGIEILPYCPFIHAYIRRHPEYLDLVSDAYPRKDQLRGEG